MAYKPRIESNNLDLTSILSTINELPEASKGVSLDVITAPSLPATVVENQIVVITDATPNTIYVDTDEPTNPVNGDVWVQVGSSDYGVEFSETFRNGLMQVAQYSGTWVTLDGFIGVSGVWRQLAKALPAKGTPLSEWTWQQIVTLANSSEDCSEWFAVGDEKDLVLSTGEVVPVVIGAFKHSRIYQTSGNAQIAFTTKNCLNTQYAMNTSRTNVGGWDGSNMRNSHMANILATFPAELQADNAIKVVEVVTSAGNKSSTLITSADKLRIHSTVELGLTGNVAAGEGTTYSYYAAGNQVKKVNGTATAYWTRSPYKNDTACFVDINNNGAAGFYYAETLRGVPLCFDI